MNKKNILVIGGSGFLGSHVCDILSNNNWNVTIIDRNKSKWLKPTQKFFKGDILNSELFYNLIKKNNYVFNFAAISDIADANKNPENTVKVNILGLVKLLSLCAKAKIERFIQASTIYVSGEHGGFYKSSKLASESYVKEFFKLKKLKYSILRFGTLYGPRSDENNGLHSMIKNSLKHKKIIYSGDPYSIRDYIHVLDGAKICEKVILDKKNFENKTVIISGPESIQIKNVLRMISEISGIKKIVYIKKNELKKHTHYITTPYSISNNFVMKHSSLHNIDFGQGLKNLILEIKDKYKY